MEYQQIYNQVQPHQQMHPGQSQIGGGLSLPDASSSSEKALMWGGSSQYMPESGYSTQAPSISGSIDPFSNNNDQMDSTMSVGNMDTNTTTTTNTVQNDWNYNKNVQQQPQPQAPAAYQQPQQQQQQPELISEVKEVVVTEDDSDNAVANWMNYQDSPEMALKAIPELLKLITDEDLIVVQQAAILFNQMSRNEGPRMALIQTNNAVQCLVDCLNTTADIETARSLVGTLYSVSTQKPAGVQAIINSKALNTLVKMLSAPMETIISYAITTLHNVLLDCGDQIKNQLRKMGVIHQMIPLLNQNTNVKFLSIVVDCLQLLAFGNSETKQIILELGGTQMLVGLLVNQTNYQKLLLNTTRLLKVLSVCSKNKQALVNCNAMQALSMHLITLSTQAQNAGSTKSTSSDILSNCLITLRNLSDAATRLNGLEQLVQNLLNLLASKNDFTVLTLAAGILSNLTCNNENNKKTALASNGIQILLHNIHTNMSVQKTQLVEPCVCALRHITNRHGDMLLAQEQVRAVNGLNIITQLMCIQPRAWSVIKAVLGLVRNFCSNQLNAQQLRQNGIIEKLMQILFDAYTEIQMRTSGGTNMPANNVLKIDDVNMFDIVEASSAALLILGKDIQNQQIMKDLDCIGFFVQMFYSSITSIQRSSVSILAELATNKECAEVIEQQAGLHQFVQANFCNQYGLLKTIAELTGQGSANNQASIILQHVTTLMQRLQEHKNQRSFFAQQQQQQQRFGAAPVINQQEQFGQQQFFNNGQSQFAQQPQQQQFNF
jgi:catenin beta 1